MPEPVDFLKAFSTAAAAPVLKSIDWPDSLQADHPVRSLGLMVRYWPVAVASFFSAEAAKQEPSWLNNSFWYLIAASVCTKDGELAFTRNWETIWLDHIKAAVAAFEQERDEWVSVAYMDPVSIQVDIKLEGMSREQLAEHFPASFPYFPVNDDGTYQIPAPDYHIVGEWLKKQYESAQGTAIMTPLWDTALKYNGWGPSEAKNSEKTDASVLSGEKQNAAL